MKKQNYEIKKENVVTLGDLYSLNKQMVLKEKPLTNSEIRKFKSKIADWFNWQIDCYAMLLCREKYDFTIFHLYEKINKNPPAVAASELIEVLKNRGEILSIEEQKNNSDWFWEIWIKINDEAYAYYLFNCDDWTIDC